MKATGIVRKVDTLGRIVLPIELRRVLGIGVKDPVEIFVDGAAIILRKYNPGCALCGSCDNVKHYGKEKDQPLCGECAMNIARSVIDERKQAKASA